MSLEYLLYIPPVLTFPDFLSSLSTQNLPFDFYSSPKHHPNAILLHRTHYSKKIQSSNFSTYPKHALLYFPTPETLFPLSQTSSFLSRYTQNNTTLILLIQGLEEFFAISNFNENPEMLQETFEETSALWMTQGVDCILTDSLKESVNFIQRILEILTKAPYNNDPSIYRIHGKKLRVNTEIPSRLHDWASQLINIPGISESKAAKILEKFPKLSDLLEYYSNPSVTNSAKQAALADLWERKEKRLAEKIFKVYSSLNPDEPV